MASFQAFKGSAWGAVALMAPACFAQPVELGDMDLPGGNTPPVVITTTRLRQPLSDVPASVTVITADTLRKLNISSVVDALRLVPGMEITEPGGADTRVNYHGTNALNPRRMNVLIDGISAYRPGFSTVYWHQLPIVMDDIDRIEVTRGPNSAGYGPNSMMAVVNIISKHPKDVPRATGIVRINDRGQREVTARMAADVGASTLRITASEEAQPGYDQLGRINQDHDSIHLKRLNLRSESRISPTENLGLQLAWVQGVNQVQFVEPYQTSFPDQKVRDIYLSGLYTQRLSSEHEWKIHINHADYSIAQAWASCLPTALLLPELYELWRLSPAAVNALLAGRVPTGTTPQENAQINAAALALRNLGARARQPTCVQANQDFFEKRTDIEFQDTRVLSEQLRVISGLGARHHVARSQTFLGGELSNDSLRAFGSIEYRPRKWLTLNAGGYIDRDRLSQSTFSPRAAANFHLSDSQTLRFVFSQGTHTPDIFEQRANWSYNLTQVAPPLHGSTNAKFYRSATAPGNLRPERMTSKELGYLLALKPAGLLLDLKVFEDRLSNLISEKLQVASFSPTNNNSLRLRGFELQSQWNWSPQSSLWFNYAYLQNAQATSVFEQTQYARHSGSLALSHQFSELWSGSVAHYAASGNGLGQSHYGRQDLAVTRQGRGAIPWRVTLGVSRLDNTSPTYFQDVGSVLENRYDNRLSVFGQLQVNY